MTPGPANTGPKIAAYCQSLSFKIHGCEYRFKLRKCGGTPFRIFFYDLRIRPQVTNSIFRLNRTGQKILFYLIHTKYLIFFIVHQKNIYRVDQKSVHHFKPLPHEN